MPVRRLLLLLAFWAFAAGALQAAEKRGVTFVSWNVQNYAPLPEPGQVKGSKSDSSAGAIALTLQTLRPDILALCEMGPPRQFAEFRQRLAALGLDYPYAEMVQAADPHRHLALLSRYPIRSRSLTDIALVVNGSHERMRRGILDVTLQLPGDQPLRIVGVHLKSKLELRDENEALLRRQEAHRLRQHVDLILTAEPEIPLLLYGDMNDTRDQTAIKEIAGERGHPMALTPLPLADPHGDRWTHYWPTADVYARIDFVMTSRALTAKVDRRASHVHRAPDWLLASDHRPLVVIFKPRAFNP